MLYIAAVWYRRKVTLTETEMQERTLLHFGAVDYHAVVWVNGQKAGEHKGGYTSFAFDITTLLQKGENEIIVYAEDDVRSEKQPIGKQCPKYHYRGCAYSRTTGIWQTVWLEFVPREYISYVKITPFADRGSVRLDIELDGAKNALVNAEVSFRGEPITKNQALAISGIASMELTIPNPKLWDIRQPNLYDLTLTLNSGDRVESYFGMRSIELKNGAFYLNGRPVFMRLVLDQGYNPLGNYTAPSDDFLREDIERSMRCGFNGGRFHEKVFEERSLYWADKLGYLVWGEAPNDVKYKGSKYISCFLPEWMEAVRRDYNHPAIIGWCPENEIYWQFDLEPITLKLLYAVTKQMDPYRPCIDSSGGHHFDTDMFDVHEYTHRPEKLRNLLEPCKEDPMAIYVPSLSPLQTAETYKGQPYWVSEYGGFGWRIDRPDGWAYGNLPETEEEFVKKFADLTNVLLEHPRICGICYTQLTDTEQEQSGLYNYDRSPKFSDHTYGALSNVLNTQSAIEKILG